MSGDPPDPGYGNAMEVAAWQAGWRARADSAVPSSHVSETDDPSVPSDRAALVDRCVPPLPKPDHKRWVDDGKHGQYEERTGGFTAEQMEEHAKATLAAFADLLGIMIASATQLVDGDAVVGYEIKTGALHRMLGMFGGAVHIPFGLPSREAVCAEPVPTTASAPATSEMDHPKVEGESILREALARLADTVELVCRVHIIHPGAERQLLADAEAARSALAGMKDSVDPTGRCG